MGEAKQDVFRRQEILPQALLQMLLHQTPQRTHPDVTRATFFLPSGTALVRSCTAAQMHPSAALSKSHTTLWSLAPSGSHVCFLTCVCPSATPSPCVEQSGCHVLHRDFGAATVLRTALSTPIQLRFPQLQREPKQDTQKPNIAFQESFC